jgi:hypothetical protein
MVNLLPLLFRFAFLDSLLPVGAVGFDCGFALSRFSLQDSKPAGRVPPDVILLPGSKSMQKCRHLAVGMSRAITLPINPQNRQ